MRFETAVHQQSNNNNNTRIIQSLEGEVDYYREDSWYISRATWEQN